MEQNDNEAPKYDDYIQLLDEKGSPCENQSNVAEVIRKVERSSAVGPTGITPVEANVWEIEDKYGIRRFIARNPDADTPAKKGFIEVRIASRKSGGFEYKRATDFFGKFWEEHDIDGFIEDVLRENGLSMYREDKWRLRVYLMEWEDRFPDVPMTEDSVGLVVRTWGRGRWHPDWHPNTFKWMDSHPEKWNPEPEHSDYLDDTPLGQQYADGFDMEGSLSSKSNLLVAQKHGDVPDEKFDKKNLMMGVGVETEHTDDPEQAKAIAKDHLTEMPNYYDKLVDMESKGSLLVDEGFYRSLSPREKARMNVWELSQVELANRNAEKIFPLGCKVEVLNGKPVYTYWTTVKWDGGERRFEIQGRSQPNSTTMVERLHKKIVQQAIAEGKEVPPEVLADYPELGIASKGSLLKSAMSPETLLRESTKGGPGLDGYAYNADVYCVDCATKLMEELAPSVAAKMTGDDVSSDGNWSIFNDSEEWPTPIFFGESDSAQHCCECGEYLYGEDEDMEEDATKASILKPAALDEFRRPSMITIGAMVRVCDECAFAGQTGTVVGSRRRPDGGRIYDVELDSNHKVVGFQEEDLTVVSGIMMSEGLSKATLLKQSGDEYVMTADVSFTVHTDEPKAAGLNGAISMRVMESHYDWCDFVNVEGEENYPGVGWGTEHYFTCQFLSNNRERFTEEDIAGDLDGAVNRYIDSRLPELRGKYRVEDIKVTNLKYNEHLASFSKRSVKAPVTYHVTRTDYVPKIRKGGLVPMGAPSNWVVQESGERYGSGEIFTFSDPTMAVRWAAKMDWEFNKSIGTGKISVLEIHSDRDWEVDSGGSQMERYEGQWLKTYSPVPPEEIVKDIPITLDITRQLVANDKVKLSSMMFADYGVSPLKEGDRVMSMADITTKQFQDGVSFNDSPEATISARTQGTVSYVCQMMGGCEEFHVKWDSGVETIEDGSSISEGNIKPLKQASLLKEGGHYWNPGTKMILLRPIWGHKAGERGVIDRNGKLRLKGSPPMTVGAEDDRELCMSVADRESELSMQQYEMRAEQAHSEYYDGGGPIVISTASLLKKSHGDVYTEVDRQEENPDEEPSLEDAKTYYYYYKGTVPSFGPVHGYVEVGALENAMGPHDWNETNVKAWMGPFSRKDVDELVAKIEAKSGKKPPVYETLEKKGSLKKEAEWYTYSPGFLDRFQPNVIKGSPIASGSRVRILRAVGDPMGKFIIIEDEAGNQQSVYKKSLEAKSRFGLAPKMTSKATLLKEETRNEDVIRMFLEDSFPKDKMPIWGTAHLKIRREPIGWSLVNYATRLLWRDRAGQVYFNTQKYSVTTSIIQNKIRRVAQELGITLVERDDDDLRKTTDEGVDKMTPEEAETTSVDWTSTGKVPVEEHLSSATLLKEGDIFSMSWGASAVPEELKGKIAVWWGARGILERTGGVSLLGDRQTWWWEGASEGKECQCKDIANSLMEWVNKKALPEIREWAGRNRYQEFLRMDKPVTDGNFGYYAYISYGYVHMAAWVLKTAEEPQEPIDENTPAWIRVKRLGPQKTESASLLK